jgi:hypothetical protein
MLDEFPVLCFGVGHPMSVTETTALKIKRDNFQDVMNMFAFFKYRVSKTMPRYTMFYPNWTRPYNKIMGK